MLFILRKIRRSFFLPGKVRTYMAYAAGEIVLIVVGIMIALEANEWKEERRDVKRETEYLNRLVANLSSDVERWSISYDWLEEKKTSLHGVLDWINDPKFEEPRLRKLATELTVGSRMAYGAGVEANRTVFDELVSTGHLNIISNSELREKIQYYYGIVEMDVLRLVGRQTKYAQRAYELVPRDPEFRVAPGLEYDDFKQIGERTLDIDLKSLIFGEQNRARLRREITDHHMRLVNELILLVTAELDNRQ